MTRLSRRTMLTVPALLSAAGVSAGACDEPETPQEAGSQALVAYFSRSGNTRVVAGTVQRALSADLFEIRPAKPYPEDYEETVEQARQERDRGVEPMLERKVPDIDRYETIFLAFPIWGETAPPIIRSFLRAHDLSEKTLQALVTHGGFGLGGSMSVLKSHAPGARLKPAFVMEADQEKRTLNTINSWLSGEGLR